MLKARPELDRLHRKLASANDGVFNFQIFEAFMRDSQKVRPLLYQSLMPHLIHS